MGRDVKKPVTEQFFDCKDKGETPPLNREGFWKKYVPKLKPAIKGR